MTTERKVQLMIDIVSLIIFVGFVFCLVYSVGELVIYRMGLK